MKTALREFMPYGAPELIEARPRHQARALVLASAGAIAVYAGVMALASLIHESGDTAKVIALPSHEVVDLVPKTALPPPTSPPSIQPIRSVDPAKVFAEPVPVRDDPKLVELPPATPSGTSVVDARGNTDAK